MLYTINIGWSHCIHQNHLNKMQLKVHKTFSEWIKLCDLKTFKVVYVTCKTVSMETVKQNISFLLFEGCHLIRYLVSKYSKLSEEIIISGTHREAITLNLTHILSICCSLLQFSKSFTVVHKCRK